VTKAGKVLGHFRFCTHATDEDLAGLVVHPGNEVEMPLVWACGEESTDIGEKCGLRQRQQRSVSFRISASVCFPGSQMQMKLEGG